MRVLFAFCLGFAVAVGGAFLRDSTAAPPARPFVNWDVVKESTDTAMTQVREQWNRLTQR
ncbi:hypothetical protein [Rhodoplanes roseus]|uniref:Transporter n=1 Tax=Rhodoplanes roseus TaxID=29409 RepID=A0A327KX35_9BRAD|nr:hypothetical protein [Rhodoplanes roseus]RAI41782.1 hypothetical protein CH341_20915 [Rhodoplanes roseus]